MTTMRGRARRGNACHCRVSADKRALRQTLTPTATVEMCRWSHLAIGSESYQGALITGEIDLSEKSIPRNLAVHGEVVGGGTSDADSRLTPKEIIR